MTKYTFSKAALALFFGLICIATASVDAQIAVKAEKIHTMNGAAITNGVILINNGKITAVGPASSVNIPANYRVMEAKVATPGLIDARTVVGLNGYLNQPHDQMALDRGGPFQPELRATDAYNATERLVEWLREHGVTTINTGHQPSSLSSGQLMIAKTTGNNVDEATVKALSMISVTLGSAGTSNRSKQVSSLRAELIKAQANAKKDEAPTDLRAEIMYRVARKEVPLLITAERAQDIMTALRIAKEFDIKIILDGASEAPQVINEIKASGFPVILHPIMARPGGDRASLSMATAAELQKAGIPFALQSGYESYVPKTRVVLFEAALAAANGLTQEQALASVTINAAKILGIDSRVGSLAVGKDADVALYTGDPFEYVTHCIGTIINGKVVSEVKR